MPPSPSPDLSEVELLAASLRGDIGAYSRLVERYQTLAWSVALCTTGDESRAEELAQEAFITAWNRLPELRDLSRFRSWLCGIVRNHARSSRRHAARHVPDQARRSELAEMPSERPTPLDHVLDDEQHRMLGDAISTLPDSYREPIVLFYGEQLPVREIAELLDLSEHTVRQRLSRGRKQLRAGMAAAVAAAIMMPSVTAAAAPLAAPSAAPSMYAPMAGAIAALVAVAVALTLVVAPRPSSAPRADHTAGAPHEIDPAIGAPSESRSEPRPASGAESPVLFGRVEIGHGQVRPPHRDVSPSPRSEPDTRLGRSGPVQRSRRHVPASRAETEVRHGPAVVERPLMRPSVELDDIR